VRLFVPKERQDAETRAAIVPETAARLVKRGLEVVIETGLGESIGHEDAQYEQAGATVTQDRQAGLRTADMIVRVRKPPIEEVPVLRRGCIHISFLDPFKERDLVEKLMESGVSAISMEMMPRITRAQKMDALSSQANLAGYYAAVLAASRLNKILPMMMTPAGTIAPAKVFVIGAGVAGLQAIATAKRLGAHVSAYDTRPMVEEQVRSLGAKFVKVDLGHTGETEEGYAVELTPEQQQMQREAMAKVCAQSDIVITTAQVFGRKAPLLIAKEAIQTMKPGSVIVDLAIETGGNVECAELDKEVEVNGVKVIGVGNLPGRVAVHASQMYSSNLGNLIEEYWDTEKKTFKVDPEEELLQGCLVTHDGRLVNRQIRQAYGLS